MSKSVKSSLKITQRPKKYRKLSIYIYISMDAHWRAVRRDLDVTKRSRDIATPKKRTLGPTPVIFFKVDVAKTYKQVFGDPQDIYICGRGEGRQIRKKSVCDFGERHKKESHKKAMEIIKKGHSGQANIKE